MSINLQKYCPAVFLLLVLTVAMEASAQIRRVSTVNPMSGGKASYDDVYDYDNVDIKPQFPGGECDLFNFINETREYHMKLIKRKSRDEFCVLLSSIRMEASRISTSCEELPMSSSTARP